MSVPVDLSVDIAGLTLKNPVMAASGTFGYGREYAELLRPERLGRRDGERGLRSNPGTGNPLPRIVETPAGHAQRDRAAKSGGRDVRQRGSAVFARVSTPV